MISPLAASTGLAWPDSVAIDASGKIYVTNGCGSLAPSVTIYAKGSNGDAPHRHHQRGQHPSELPTRHRGGFQRQDLCGGHIQRAVGLCGAGKQHRVAQRSPHRHHLRDNTGMKARATSRWIPAVKSTSRAPFLTRKGASPAVRAWLSMRRGATATSHPSPPSPGTTPA